MGRETLDERHDRIRRAGRWLRQERDSRGWTQADLAERLTGVTQHAVSAFERGAYEVEAGIARDIARVFELAEYDVWKGLEIPLPVEVDDPERAITWMAGRLKGRQMVALARRAAPELMAKSPGAKTPPTTSKRPKTPRPGEKSQRTSSDEQNAI